MTYEFSVPLNRDDLLRQSAVNQYVVDEVFPIRTLAGKLKECQSQFRSDGSLMILRSFDTYFSVLVHFNSIEPDIQKEAWMQLLRVLQSLPAVLVESLEHNDLTSDLRQARLNAVKMTTYLVCQMCDRYEAAADKPNAVVAATKGRKKTAKSNVPDLSEVDWHDDERERAVRALLQLMQLNINRLWDPPVIEEEFVSLITNICYKLLENQSVSKNKGLRDTIFQLLGIMVKRYNHTIGCTLKMLQLLQQYEHLAVPFAQAIELFVNYFGVKGIVSELMREIGRMDPKELSRDTSGTRAYATFLLELARCVPSVMLQSISIVLVLLDGESYTMRNSVLGVLGEMVVRVLSGGELDSKHKSTRDQFLDKLEDHIHDVNAFVRSRVLQIWLNIVTEKALPLPRQNMLLQLVIGRLQDKSSQVRKNAIQVVIALIKANPLAAQLAVEELRTNYEKELDNLNVMMPEQNHEVVCTAVQAGLEVEWANLENDLHKALKKRLKGRQTETDDDSQDYHPVKITEDETVDSVKKQLVEAVRSNNFESAFDIMEALKKEWPEDPVFATAINSTDNEDDDNDDVFRAVDTQLKQIKSIFFGEVGGDNKAAVEHDSSMVSAVSKQQVLVQYLKDSMNFVMKIDEAIPLVCQLLWSKTPTDVLEAVDFFVSGFEAGVTACLIGIRRMLSLVRSKEPAIKSAVVDAYRRIYLNPTGSNARVQSVTIANALIALTISGSSLGELESLAQLIQEFVRGGELNSKVIQVLWEKFTLKITPTKPEESRGALVLIGMAAGAEVEIVRGNVNTLIKEGLGCRADEDYKLARDTCAALLKLAVKSKSGDFQKPYRLNEDNELFGRLSSLLINGLTKLDKEGWIPMAELAINLIYRLAEHPDVICANIIRNLAKELIQFNDNNLPQAIECDGDVKTEDQVTASQGDHKIACPARAAARFLFLCGHVALQELVFLDVAIFGELKRRRAICEGSKQDKVSNKSAKRQSLSAAAAASASRSVSKSAASEQTIEEEMGLAGAVAEDAEAEGIRRIAETEVVTGSDTILANLRPLIVAVCSNPSKYNDPQLTSAATSALTKFMIVSSEFCEQHLQLLFTILEKSSNPTVRANVVIALGDLTFRFPNLIEPWTAHIYARLRDDSTLVRKNTVLVLTHLILNDMIKVKGQISELATCVIDSNSQIAELSKVFFSDLAKRGNAIYNILPDVISRLSDPDVGILEDNFHTILRYLMSFIQKDRQCESLVEKLCHRFRATQSERQWRDLAFCLSLLSYNDKSVRKLQENFACFGDKLSEDFVYNCFTAIIAGARKFCKPEAKAVIDEFEQRVQETHTKGVADDAVAQKATKASQAAKTVAGRKAAKTPGRQGKAVKHKVSSNDDEENSEEAAENNDQQMGTTQPRARQSQRPRPAKQRQVLHFSSDEDEDFSAATSQKGKTSKAAAANDSDSEIEPVVVGRTKRATKQSVCSQPSKPGRRK